MCGIIGCSLSRPLQPDDLDRLRKMRDRLNHRGPDGFGEHYDMDQGLYLGHRRLSIVDLDHSTQPMSSGQYVLTYNGEIYNYRAIQKELSEHCELKTYGDTEVVLKGWQVWGRDVLNRFDGMFAFALWDGQQLYLATDFFGEKPLYIYRNEDGIHFSSEPGPLVEAFGLEFEPAEEERLDLLYLGYIRPPYTGFRGMENIQPAQLLTVKDGNVIGRESYWAAPEPFIGKGKIQEIGKQDVDRVRDLLCESLEDRLNADVPVGLFLSGGVDSCLIAALASRELQVDINAYTVSFPDGHDENTVACNIAQRLEISHTTINSLDSDFWKDLPTHMADTFGVPNDNVTALAVRQMCEVAKKYLTVAISGLGGDEIFYGYNKYNTSFKYKNLYRNNAVLECLSSFGRGLSGKINLLHDLMRGDADRQYLRIKNSAEQNILEQLTRAVPKNVLLQKHGDLVHRLQNYDIHMSMPQSFIPAFDRGSMKASVEVRTPFLSRKLLSHVYSLDQRSLIAYGQKNVLKKLLSRYLDPSLLMPAKQGFIFPAARYYRERNPALPTLDGLDPDEIRKIWDQKEVHAFQQLVIRLSLLSHFGGRDIGLADKAGS